MNPGIESLKGFMFQIKVFFKSIIDNVRFFPVTYEGKDDIEYGKEDDKLYLHRIAKSEYSLVQVKNGTLTKSSICRIITNWILNCVDAKSTKFVLIHSQDCVFESKDEIIKKYIAYIVKQNNKEKALRIDSYDRIIYDKYYDKNVPQKELLEKLDSIVSSMLTYVQKMDEVTLEDNILSSYSSIYCADLETDIAKEKRLQVLIDQLQRKLFDAVSKGEPYQISYSEFNAMNNIAIGQVTDDKYDPTFTVFINKKTTKEIQDEIFLSRALEVRQLKLASLTDAEILKHLGYELFYRDIREHFISKNEDEINDLELIAFENYEEDKYNYSTPRELFQNVINKNIDYNQIKLNNFSRKGCYIHLTSEEGDISKRIKWGGDESDE